MNGDLLRSNVTRAAMLAVYNINMKQSNIDYEDTCAAISVARRVIRQLRDQEAFLSIQEATVMVPYGRPNQIAAGESNIINRLIMNEARSFDSVPEWLFQPMPHCDSQALSYADDLLTLLARGAGNGYTNLTDTATEAVEGEDITHDLDAVNAATDALKEVTESSKDLARGMLRYEQYIRHTILKLLKAYSTRKTIKFDNLQQAIIKYNPVLKRAVADITS